MTTLLFMMLLSSVIISLIYQIESRSKQEQTISKILQAKIYRDTAIYQIISSLNTELKGLALNQNKNIHINQIDNKGNYFIAQLVASEKKSNPSQNNGYSTNSFNETLYQIGISTPQIYLPAINTNEINQLRYSSIDVNCLKATLGSQINILKDNQDILMQQSMIFNDKLSHWQYRVELINSNMSGKFIRENIFDISDSYHYFFEKDYQIITSNYDIFSNLTNNKISVNVLFFARKNNKLHLIIINDSGINLPAKNQNIDLNIQNNGLSQVITDIDVNENNIIIINTNLSVNSIDLDALQTITINNQQSILIPISDNKDDDILLSAFYDLLNKQIIFDKKSNKKSTSQQNFTLRHPDSKLESAIQLIVNKKIIINDEDQHCYLSSVNW